MASSNNEAEKQEGQKLTSSTTAGEVIASDQDLAAQILICLPPRLVCHSKLVSKQWLSIISNPDFISCYTISRPPPLCGLFLHYLAGPKAIKSHQYIPFNPIDHTSYHPTPIIDAQVSEHLEILQSCNGLLLCCYTSKSDYYVYNPTTFQRKQIPLPRGLVRANDFALNLAFDPSKSLHYKVVCARKCLGLDRFQLEVYSSETDQWRKSGEPFIEPDVTDFRRGVFCKGAVHWIKSTSNLLYYDTDNESLTTTPKPPLTKFWLYQRHEYFGQSNGRLYVVMRGAFPNFMVLQMKADYSGWFVTYIIDLDELATKFPSMTRSFSNTPRMYQRYECSVVYIAPAFKEDGLEIMVSTPGEVVVVDTKINASKKITVLVLHPHYMSFWYKFSAHEYCETLCPV